MTIRMSRKSMVKFGKTGAVLFTLAVLAYLAVTSFAGVSPGQLPVPSTWINITTSDANQTDDFFTCGNVVYLRSNVTCNGATVCNESLVATANYTGIGGDWRQGVNVSHVDGTDGWRLFEFNDTVDCGTGAGQITITNFQAANISINASTYDTSSTDVGWTFAILVNMSSMPGCPPASEGIQLPPQVPLLNGQMVPINGTCITTCTADDRAQFNGTHYNLCGPNFGGDSTNFTAEAYSRNFSAIPIVIDIPGKAKINFTQGVNMSDQQKAGAVMQFAMKNLMSGGRVGVNESEWDGTGGKPDLRMQARLTIYNVSGRFGISAPHSPQIGYASSYGGSYGGSCPTNVCSSVVWDGENFTFTVSGFSEYSIEQGLSVVLNTPANFSYVNNNSFVSQAPFRNINFTFTPTWNATVTPRNATLFGNFTDNGSWVSNVTNATSLVNASVNGINFTVPADRAYLWNMVIYDTTGLTDTSTNNYTVTVDTVAPALIIPAPSNNGFFNDPSTRLFQINLTETNRNNSVNVTVYYRRQNVGNYLSSTLQCWGPSPNWICNKTIDVSSYVTNTETLEFIFNTTDLAGNTGANGTVASPLTATVDTTVPGSVTGLAHSDDAPTGYDNDTTLVFNWTAAADATAGIDYYNIYVSTDGGAYSLSGTNNSATGYSFSGSDGSTYTVNVTSVDRAGNENTTGTVSSAVIVDTSAPSLSPSSVAFVAYPSETYSNRTTLVLNWTAGSDTNGIKQYKIYISENNGSYIFNGTNNSATGYSFTGVDARNYTVNVTAVDTADNENVTGSLSNTTIWVDTTEPTSVTNLVPTGNSTVGFFNSTTVVFNWTAATDATSGILKYNIYVSAGAAYVLTGSNTSETGYWFAGTDGTTYTVNVTAMDQAQNENMTGTVSESVTIDTTLPTVPRDVVFAADPSTTFDNDVDLVVNWTAATDTNGILLYRVYISTDGGAYAFSGNNNSANGYSFTGADGSTYRVNVTAVDKANNWNNTGNVSETTITVDTTNPAGIVTVSPTLANNSYTSSNWVYVNTTFTEANPDSALLEWHNGTQANYTMTRSGTNAYINMTNQPNGVWNYTVYVNDSAGNQGSNGTFFVTVDSTNPVINNTRPVKGGYINSVTATLFQVDLTEQNLDTTVNVSVYYRRQSVGSYQTGTLQCWGTAPGYTCNKTIDISSYIGNNEVLEFIFNTTDLAGNTGANGTIASPLTATVDVSQPQWVSNGTSVATGSAYTSGQNYGFDINWTNGASGLDTILFESNFTGTPANYSSASTPAVQTSGSTYYINFTQEQFKGAYTYAFKWYANDTVANINSTDQWVYTIAKASTTLNLYLNGTSNNNASVTYPEQVNATATLDVGGLYFWILRDGALQVNGTSSIFNITSLANATYNFTAVFPGNENYSSSSQVSKYAHVNKGSSSSYLGLFIDDAATDKSITYPNTATARGNVSTIVGASDITYTLYRNNTNITSGSDISNSDRLDNGTWVFVYNTSGGANWTSGAAASRTLYVNKGVPQVSLFITPGASVTYPTAVTVNGNETNVGDADLTYILYRNDTDINSTENGTSVLLGAGVYSYVFNATSGANWTSNATGATITLTVSQNTSTSSYMNLTLNSTETNRTYTYPTAVNATAWNDSSVFAGQTITFTLFRNDGTTETQVGTGNVEQNILLGNSTYNYTYYTAGNANYSSGIKTFYLFVNKGYVPLHLAINDTESGASYGYENTTNATGWSDLTGQDLTFTLWRDNTNVSSGNSVSDVSRLGVAAYTYVFNTSGGSNYTSNSTARTLTITQKPISIYLALNGTQGSNSATYPAAINATVWKDSTSQSNDVNVSLWRNGTLVASTISADSAAEEIQLGNATYNYTAMLSSTNYTASAIANRYAYVNKGDPSSYLSLFIDYAVADKSVTYPAIANVSANVSGIAGATDLTYSLYRDYGTLLASGSDIFNYTRLGNNTYTFQYNTSGGANWTSAAAASRTLYVNKGAVALKLYFNGTESSYSITYPAAVNATGNVSATVDNEGNLTLWRNATIVASTLTGTSVAENILLGNGTYNYTLTYTATNYTDASVANWTYVNKGVSNISLWLNNNEADLSVELGVNVNATATINTSYATTFYLTTNITGWGTKTSSANRIENTTETSEVTVANWYNVTAYFAGDGNYTSDSQTYWLNITPDVTSPTVLLYDYTNATVKKSSTSLTLNVSVSDSGTGATGNVSVAVGGTFAGNISSSGSGWYNGSVTVPSLSDGNRLINLTISDVQGNMGENSSYVVNVDNTAPIITITTPSNNTYVKIGSDGNVWINGTVSDNTAMGSGNVTINSTSFGVYNFSGGNNTAFSIKNTSYIADGYVSFTINYTDSVSNLGESVVYFYVDNTPSTSFTALTTGTKAASSTQTVQVTVADNLMTNASITLFYKRGGMDTSWQTATMTGTPGSSTTYSETIDTSMLGNNENIYYYVTGVDNATNPFSTNNGTNTNPLSHFTIGVVTAPLQPTSLSAVQVGSTKQVNISWTASASEGVTGYYVYRSSGVVTTASTNLGETGNVTQFTDTVPADGTWNYTVVAHDSVPNVNTTIADSASVTVTTSDTTAPVNPSSVSVAQVGSTREINVSWSASTSNDAIAYNVYYKLGGSVTTSDNSKSVGNVTKTSVTLGQDGNWNFTVTAVDSSNNENTTIAFASNITINTNTTGSIDGYVMTNDSSPSVISGAAVSDGTRSAVTNTNGYYLIDSVPAGTYTVTASLPGYVTNSTSSVAVSVGSTTRANITMLNNNTGMIDGYVYLTNTSTVPNSSLVVSDGTRNSPTDSAGHYRISGVPPGTYTVTASGNGYWSNSTSAAVTAGATTSLNIRVTGAENYNVSRASISPPGITTGFLESGWNDFFLSTRPFSAGTTNYNISSLFSSISSNYTIVYRYNATSGVWTSYVPGAASNDLTAVASTDDHYWISMNATDRIEIEPRYT